MNLIVPLCFDFSSCAPSIEKDLLSSSGGEKRDSSGQRSGEAPYKVPQSVDDYLSEESNVVQNFLTENREIDFHVKFCDLAVPGKTFLPEQVIEPPMQDLVKQCEIVDWITNSRGEPWEAHYLFNSETLLEILPTMICASSES